MIRWMIQSPLYFIPLAALLTACIGLEPQIAVGEHLGTYHLDRTPWLNENNPGWQLTVGRLQVGGYLNSFGNMSFYVTRRFDGHRFHHLRDPYRKTSPCGAWPTELVVSNLWCQR